MNLILNMILIGFRIFMTYMTVIFWQCLAPTFFDWARVFFFSCRTCFDGRHQLLIFPKSLISVHIPLSKSPSNRIKKYKSHWTVRAYVHFDQIFVPWRTNNFSWKKVQRFNLKWNCRLPYIILWLVMFFLWRL